MISSLRLLQGAALLVAGLCVLAACAVVPETPRPGLPASPEAFLDRLKAEEEAVKTLRGLASVRYQGQAGDGSATQVIVVALPDRARLETLSPMGTAVLLLTIQGEDLTMYAPTRHEYGAGPATPETLGRLLRVPVPPRALLRLLAGLPPLPIRHDDPRVQLNAEAKTIRLESVDGGFWQRVWSNPDGTAERGELGGAGGPLLTFEFSDRRRLNGTAFPFAMHLDDARTGARLGIQYKTVGLNDPLEAGLFQLPRPADGTVRMLDLGAGPLP